MPETRARRRLPLVVRFGGYVKDNDWSVPFWLVLGWPAVLAWIGYGLAILLAPHLSSAPDPLRWAFYGAISLPVSAGAFILLFGGRR